MAEPADLRAEIAELQAERDALLAQVEKDDHWPAWYYYQRKAVRQRRALDTLNRRVVSQRFVLRTLEQLGRGLSRDEYVAAREAVENEQLRNRIEERK